MDKTENYTEPGIEPGIAWEELGISNDFMFGKIMQDPELCKELLHRILPELKIDRIEYPELQKSIRTDADAKSVRLDLQILDKGQSYKQLKPIYIIFICLFDLFEKGRHIYTFENICKEDPGIFLKDGTVKIFLNAKGTQDDVSKELKAFLDYVAGQKSDDAYVEKLEEAVKRARENREWRHEYMTLLMRDQENIEKGVEQGIRGAVSILKDLGLSLQVIQEKIQEQYNLSAETAKKYL